MPPTFVYISIHGMYWFLVLRCLNVNSSSVVNIFIDFFFLLSNDEEKNAHTHVHNYICKNVYILYKKNHKNKVYWIIADEVTLACHFQWGAISIVQKTCCHYVMIDINTDDIKTSIEYNFDHDLWINLQWLLAPKLNRNSFFKGGKKH